MKTIKTFVERVILIYNSINKTAKRKKSLVLQWNQPVVVEGVAIRELSVCTSYKEHTFFNQSSLSHPFQAHIGTPPKEYLHNLDHLFPCIHPPQRTIRCCSLMVMADHNHFFLYQTQCERSDPPVHRSIEYYYVDRDVEIQTTRTSQECHLPPFYFSTPETEKNYVWHYSLQLYSGWNPVFVSRQMDSNQVRIVEYSTSCPCSPTDFKWKVLHLRLQIRTACFVNSR